MFSLPNNLTYTCDHLDIPDGAMIYVPDYEVYEGTIWLISPRRTHGIILTEDDEKISFSFDELIEGNSKRIKPGDWVIFEKHFTEYRTTAIKVRNT